MVRRISKTKTSLSFWRREANRYLEKIVIVIYDTAFSYLAWNSLSYFYLEPVASLFVASD